MTKSKSIEVVFENGVLKPLKKTNFKEGELLKINIEKKDMSTLENLKGSLKGVFKNGINYQKKVRGEWN